MTREHREIYKELGERLPASTISQGSTVQGCPCLRIKSRGGNIFAQANMALHISLPHRKAMRSIRPVPPCVGHPERPRTLPLLCPL